MPITPLMMSITPKRVSGWGHSGDVSKPAGAQDEYQYWSASSFYITMLHNKLFEQFMVERSENLF